MGFHISTLADLTKRARESFRANIPGSDAWLWPNNVYASAKVIAGAVYEVFGFADYIAKQKFALTADSEHLDLHGQEIGLARKPAQPASGSIVLATDGDCAVAVSALFSRLDGVQYRATAAVSRTGAGDLSVPVVAMADGAASNALAGTELQIVSGVTGDATAEVGDDGVAGGADVEPDGAPFSSDLATFRGRILFRKRNPPHGGAPADYVTWCGEVSGVSRVFVERRWNGPGTVRVFPLMDSLFDHGIPDAGALDRVQDYIESVAPASAIVTVAAPSPVAVDVIIQGLSPDTTSVREAIVAELRAAFRRQSRVAGGDQELPELPYLAHPASFSRSWIVQAIANATGEERHVVLAPSADTALSVGQIAVLGVVSFV